jgi:hypothetical protein
MTERNRIPLPGRSLRLHAYDGPGINKEDNKAFKVFGNAHVALLESQGSTFCISHSQEAGDVVPFGGAQHLGSTTDPKELETLQRWMRFQTEVYERLMTAQDPAIARSDTAHGTRFQNGREGVDFKRTTFDPLMQGIVDEGTQARAKFLKANVWKIGYFTSIFNEALRLSTSHMALLALKNAAEPARGKASTDGNGVFAVNEREGVKSTNPDSNDFETIKSE